MKMVALVCIVEMLLASACRHVSHCHLPLAKLVTEAIVRRSPCVVSLQHVTLQPVRFAGHSHWKNIQHTKEAKDLQKQKTSTDVVRRIRNAVRDGGSTNPKLNSLLARVMEEGKAKDVPATTMLDALRRMEKAKDLKGSVVFVEAKGICNCLLVVETYTDRPKWTRQLVQHVMKKYGGSIGESGTSMHSFDLKGVIYVPISKDAALSKDDALEAAIDAGAEDVHEALDEDEKPVYQFLCAPKQLHTVKKALEQKNVQTGAARLEYVPHTFAALDSDNLGRAVNMLDELSALDEVVRVFDNITDDSSGQS